MSDVTKTSIQTNLLRKEFLTYLTGLLLLFFPDFLLAQQLEHDAQEDEEQDEEYYDDRYKRNQRGKIIHDNESGNLYDAYQQLGSRRKKIEDNNASVGAPGGLSFPGFGSTEDEAMYNKADKLMQEQNETPILSDPSKANEEITPKDPDGEQTPSLPSDPDLPVDSGLYYAFAAGILYCSRKIYFNKKAA